MATRFAVWASSCALVFAMGCGGDAETPAPASVTGTVAATSVATAVSTARPPADDRPAPEELTEGTAEPTAEPQLWHEEPVSTGVEEYDGIVVAVLDGDIDALLWLVEMQALGCVPSAPNELVIAPGCAAGEAEGTVVEVFPIGVCHPQFLRDAVPLLEQMVAEVRGLYGITVEREGGQARVVFSGEGFGPGYDPAYVAYVSEVGRIVEIHHSCGGPDFYLNWGDEADMLVAPPS